MATHQITTNKAATLVHRPLHRTNLPVHLTIHLRNSTPILKHRPNHNHITLSNHRTVLLQPPKPHLTGYHQPSTPIPKHHRNHNHIALSNHLTAALQTMQDMDHLSIRVTLFSHSIIISKARTMLSIPVDFTVAGVELEPRMGRLYRWVAILLMEIKEALRKAGMVVVLVVLVESKAGMVDNRVGDGGR